MEKQSLLNGLLEATNFKVMRLKGLTVVEDYIKTRDSIQMSISKVHRILCIAILECREAWFSLEKTSQLCSSTKTIKDLLSSTWQARK